MSNLSTVSWLCPCCFGFIFNVGVIVFGCLQVGFSLKNACKEIALYIQDWADVSLQQRARKIMKQEVSQVGPCVILPPHYPISEYSS